MSEINKSKFVDDKLIGCASIILVGLCYQDEKKYLPYGLNLLKKISKITLDNSGFPKSRSIKQLIFYLKYYILIREWFKESQINIPEHINETIYYLGQGYAFVWQNLKSDILYNGNNISDNNNFDNYMTSNYYLKHAGMAQPISFATSQPNVFYNGSHMVGLGGCNVDSDSNLRIGSIQTNPKCRISLQQRPFMTVPFLGRGRPQPVKESKLQQGVYIGDKKSCKKNTEKSFGFEQVDLVPSLQETIQNPANLIEGEANKGWIRGGIPSREITRDNDYFQRKYR